MRPVDKASAPNAYAVYQDALHDLRSRLGGYCSYCERYIETHLAVEHVQPKSRHAKLKTAWSNLLLACVHCNSSKGKKRVALKKFYWPDRDNTLRAITYGVGGTVHSSVALSTVEQAKASATIALTGLDKDPGNATRKPTPSDERWLRRKEAWDLAQHYVAGLPLNDTPFVRDLIVEVAKTRGMFSIWWTAFAGDADMRHRLRQAFAGTCTNSFDASGNLQARRGGQL
jgi:uncharacterized protein (TIGR02646 family)